MGGKPMQKIKIPISKAFLKKNLKQNEPLSKSISRFIDNSLIAKSSYISKDNPCIITISTKNNSLYIQDNSGGIDSSKTENDIFKLDISSNKKFSGNGLKLSFLTLGNKLDIYSNNKSLSRNFCIDLNSNDIDLTVHSNIVKSNPSIPYGTTIIITDLESHVIKTIKNKNLLNSFIHELGSRYRMCISKGLLIIKVNDNIVKDVDINGIPILSKEVNLLNHYNIQIYKCSDRYSSGIEVFINSLMKYDLDEGKARSSWRKLTRNKHSFKNCVVVVTGDIDDSKFEEDETRLFDEIIDLVKSNSDSFRSNTVIVQFEIPIILAEALMEFFNVDSAKALGEKGVHYLNEIYKNSKSKNNNS